MDGSQRRCVWPPGDAGGASEWPERREDGYTRRTPQKKHLNDLIGAVKGMIAGRRRRCI